ncbi:hypothetical protein P280DRAFT_477305 [Massarina eburnea CBS 473.64]|uniref:C2H2-type domain-containing protein n=1 Tax=Massarina eburnea CBS 473.64 TaxID=1395130 RepID=A0A6A6S7Z0_9PLEO|nr:hypothetical protein P280DRAFT_477305 [Massarina eburnea CBS 473.64]
MSCGSEADVKDTASEYSMDSAYHSQSGANQRGTMMPEEYQWTYPENAGQSYPYENSSPQLGADQFTPFSGSQDMDHIHMSPTAAAMDAGAPFEWTTNNTMGQEFFNYPSTNVSQFSQMNSPYEMGLSWGNTNTSFNGAVSSIPYGPHQGVQEHAAFTAPRQMHRQQDMPSVDTSVRPAAMRSASFATPRHSPQTPAQLGPLITRVTTPSSTVAEMARQRSLDARIKMEGTTAASAPAQSPIDEEDGDEDISPFDAEANRIQEEHKKVARTHPLYNAKPKEDGNFHCPFEGQPGCNHKPTDLKCNHDKYVDSHLKPYRCNREGCPNVQFSSTACLLRHEREAHALHGHGKNPNLCYYTDCERAMAGNGFRRRYNLFDHMKRVHDYTGPTNDVSTSPSTESQAPKARGTAGRKKKSVTDAGVQKKHKITKASNRKQLQQQQQQQQQRAQLQERFVNTKQSLVELLNKLTGPDDLEGEQIERLTADLDDLSRIASSHKSSGRDVSGG